MNEKFNLTNLLNIYNQAKNETKNYVFEINIGRGRFLFMSFFSDDDLDSKDKLYIYMRNTNNFRTVKLYGNHSKGDFFIYLNENLKIQFVNELQLTEGDGTFCFSTFMEQLNQQIPDHISPERKATLMRENSELIIQANAIEDSDKIYFGGPKKLSIGTPQDKTLRKLYMFTNNDPKDIDSFIKILKKINYTVAWFRKKPDTDFDIRGWIDSNS